MIYTFTLSSPSIIYYHRYAELIGIALAVIFLAGYPLVKSDFMNNRTERAKEKFKIIVKNDPAWNPIPTASFIRTFYPDLLHALAVNDLGPVSAHLTPEFIAAYQKKFQRWKQQKTGYKYVWIQIEHVELTGLKKGRGKEGNRVKIFVSGESVDYMHELGSTTAMGGQTRRKKEFQDVLVFKRCGDPWLLDKVYRDAYFWQI